MLAAANLSFGLECFQQLDRLTVLEVESSSHIIERAGPPLQQGQHRFQ
jgi:hypothetical protein